MAVAVVLSVSVVPAGAATAGRAASPADLPPQSEHEYRCSTVESPAQSVDTFLFFTDTAPTYVFPGDPVTLTDLTIQLFTDVTGTPSASSPITVSSLVWNIDTRGETIPSDVAVTDPGGPVTADGFTSAVTSATWTASLPAVGAEYFPALVTFTTTQDTTGQTTVLHHVCTTVEPVLPLDLSVTRDFAMDDIGRGAYFVQLKAPAQPPAARLLGGVAVQLVQSYAPFEGVLRHLWLGDDAGAIAPLVQAILFTDLAVRSGGLTFSAGEVGMIDGLDRIAARAIKLAAARAGCPTGPSCPTAVVQTLANMYVEMAASWSARATGQTWVATLLAADVAHRAWAIAPSS
jgi:hypothetical protein